MNDTINFAMNFQKMRFHANLYFLHGQAHFMYFCNFATRYFLSLKTQSVSHVIKYMFKVQISTGHSTSNTN